MSPRSTLTLPAAINRASLGTALTSGLSTVKSMNSEPTPLPALPYPALPSIYPARRVPLASLGMGPTSGCSMAPQLKASTPTRLLAPTSPGQVSDLTLPTMDLLASLGTGPTSGYSTLTIMSTRTRMMASTLAARTLALRPITQTGRALPGTGPTPRFPT